MEILTFHDAAPLGDTTICWIVLDLPAMGRFILYPEKKEVSLAMDTRQPHQESAPPMLPQAGMTISELARLTGFNAKAIRYYEQIGILPHSARSACKFGN